MRSLNIFSQNNLNPRGFTLIEILISIGILSLLLALGLFMTIDAYRGYVSRSEQTSAVSLLQRARSSAMANTDQSPWGVCYSASGPNFVLFSGSGYAANNASNEVIPASSGTTITSVPSTFACAAGSGAVFSQLAGTTTAVAITIVQTGRTQNVSINNEGAIIW